MTTYAQSQLVLQFFLLGMRNSLSNALHDTLTRRLLIIAVLLSLFWVLLVPFGSILMSSGLGGHVSEQSLGDGTDATPFLGDSADGPILLGTVPFISTLSVTDATISGVATATLRGTIGNLNGMPRGSYWFTWGYDPTALSNTTAETVITTTGTKTTGISGFNAKQEVFYRFWASTDGTTSGSVLSFGPVDTGFNMLNILLPILIAVTIFVFVLGATGQPVLALVGSIIGLLCFAIVRAMLDAML